MSDLILPSVVAALAHKRLREAAAALGDKATAIRYDAAVGFLSNQATDPVVFQPSDQRMLALIQAGRDILTGKSAAALPPNLRIGSGLGRFAVLGTTGFEWASYAEHFTSDPMWRAGAMRRGSADPNFSLVIVPTTEFALQVGALGRQKTTKADEQREIAAFAGGLLAAAATDVVLGPMARGLRADLSTVPHDRHGPAAMSGAGRRAIDDLMGGPGTWQEWWPDERQVPAALYDGYIAALEQVYGFLSTPTGFAPFLASFEPGDALNRKRLAAGVSFLTQDLVTSNWGIGHWYLVLSPALVSVPLTMLAGRFMAPGNGFFTAGATGGALGGLQLYSLAAGIASITPFALSMYLWSQVPEHANAFITALVLGILRLGLTPATVGAAAAGSDAATWILWAVQAATDLYSMINGFIALGKKQAGDAFVHLFGATPFVFGLTALGFAALFDAVEALTTELGYWLTWAVLTVAIMVPAGIGWAAGMKAAGGVGGLFAPDRHAKLPVIEALQALAAGLPSTRPAVFDESTIWRNPAIAAGDPAALTELRYPTDRQPLVKVWWTGAGSLEIAHDDHTIRLRVDGGAPTVITLRPDELTGLAISIKLDDAMVDLNTALVDPLLDQRLAFPTALADPGDGESTMPAHDRKAGDFQPVGTTEADAYLLRSAPRALVSTRVGLRSGRGQRTQAIGVVPGRSPAELDDSAVGLAADLAAMLVTGAAPTLATGLPTVGGVVPAPVYQVFRQWNLDERRLNEWRMLVEGGAVSEKANPAAHEPGMRPHPNAAAYASAAPGGEDLLNDMGWVRTWRAWLRMASDVTTDTSATTAEPYTPSIERRDGTTVRPTNAQLTEAMRFLFDLP